MEAAGADLLPQPHSFEGFVVVKYPGGTTEPARFLSSDPLLVGCLALVESRDGQLFRTRSQECERTGS
jgi:hypothetical protein